MSRELIWPNEKYFCEEEKRAALRREAEARLAEASLDRWKRSLRRREAERRKRNKDTSSLRGMAQDPRLEGDSKPPGVCTLNSGHSTGRKHRLAKVLENLSNEEAGS